MTIYSNKFTVVLSDTARIIFQDEWSIDGLPKSIFIAAEIVMTVENFKQLISLGDKMLREKS